MINEILIIAQFASTSVLVGVIWTVQLVQYPSFKFVGSSDFTKFHAAHTFWVTPIVAPAMFIELISSIFILIYPPQNVGFIWLWSGLILTIVVWISTMFIQVPIHNRLALGFDLKSINLLVNSNWIRTIAWSLRGVLVLFLLSKTIQL